MIYFLKFWLHIRLKLWELYKLVSHISELVFLMNISTLYFINISRYLLFATNFDKNVAIAIWQYKKIYNFIHCEI